MTFDRSISSRSSHAPTGGADRSGVDVHAVRLGYVVSRCNQLCTLACVRDGGATAIPLELDLRRVRERHYHPPLAGLIVIRTCYVVVGLCVILAITEHASPVFVAIVCAAAAWTVGMGERGIRSGGLYETETGITNRRLSGFGVRRERWNDIDRFVAVKRRVRVILRDGKSWRLVGVSQGARIRWAGGQSSEIVTVLNERLELWRASTE